MASGKNFIIIGGAVLVAGLVWHMTRKPCCQGTESEIVATEQVVVDPSSGMVTSPVSFAAIGDMESDKFAAFATPENLKDIQNSVKYTVEIIKDAMRENKMAEDEIELIDDLPEADEIVKKDGWLEKDKATQQAQIQKTDVSIKTAFLNLLDGKFPVNARAKYDAYLADGTIKYPVVIE